MNWIAECECERDMYFMPRSQALIEQYYRAVSLSRKMKARMALKWCSDCRMWYIFPAGEAPNGVFFTHMHRALFFRGVQR